MRLTKKKSHSRRQKKKVHLFVNFVRRAADWRLNTGSSLSRNKQQTVSSSPLLAAELCTIPTKLNNPTRPSGKIRPAHDKKQKHTCNKALHQTPPLSLAGARRGSRRGLVTITLLGHCSLAYQADWHLRRRGLHSLSSPMRWMGGASLSPSHWNPRRSSGLRRPRRLRRRHHSEEETRVRSVSRERCPPRPAAVGRALCLCLVTSSSSSSLSVEPDVSSSSSESVESLFSSSESDMSCWKTHEPR